MLKIKIPEPNITVHQRKIYFKMYSSIRNKTSDCGKTSDKI